MQAKNHRFFSPALTALYLRCTKNDLRTWEKEGKLHPIRINKRGDRRYRQEEIENIIDEYPQIWKPHIERLNKLIAAKKIV